MMSVRIPGPWLLAGAVLCLSAWFFPYFPSLGSPNELTRLYLTRAIVDHGSFAIDGPVASYGRITDLARAGDHLYSDKAPGVGLAGVPLYLVVKALAGWDAEAVSNATLLRWMRLFLAGLPTAAIVLLFFFLLGRLELAREMRLFLAAAYGLGTIAFSYGVLLFGHQISALCLVGAFCLIERQSRIPTRIVPVAIGGCLGAALLMEYTTLLFVVPCALYAAFCSPRRPRDILLGLAGCLVPLGLLAAYHMICFSGPFSTGYSHLAHRSFAAVHERGLWGMTTPSFRRLLVILTGSNKGLWFFSPWLLLAVPGLVVGIAKPLANRWRTAWIAISVATVLYLLFAMSLQLSAWGWSLGPRHFCPMLPFWVLAAGALLRLRPRWSRWTERALVVLVPYSIVAVVLPTVVFGGFPPDFSNPLADFSLPLLLSGCLSPSVGTWLGLSPGWAAVPFFAALLGVMVWMLLIVKRSRLEKAVCLLVSAGLLLLVLSVTGPPDPREERAFHWVRQDILECRDG